jgi:hypothetical protein
MVTPVLEWFAFLFSKALIVCEHYLYRKMSDPEKLKNNSEEHDRFDSTAPDNKPESSGIKGFKEKMVGKITAQIATNVFMAAFIAAIVGAFTLFGVVVYQIRGEYRTKQ